jgi:F420-dependent methylenetetrahydromethanopterin dehydrogenase
MRLALVPSRTGVTHCALCLRHSEAALPRGGARAQALAAAKAALERLDAAGVPWRRPADYYAEMVKSDAHMARVKAQLMHEQAQIEAADERCVPRAPGAAAGDAPRVGAP